jgi:hypothetical protein
MVNIEALLLKGMLIEDIVEEHFDELYEHFCNNGEMPYGVAKARTGDPAAWLVDRLEEEYA